MRRPEERPSKELSRFLDSTSSDDRAYNSRVNLTVRPGSQVTRGVRLYERTMNTISEHPWQRGPSELIKFALQTSKSDSPINQLVSFLLFDFCVETTMRTFLSLPDGLFDTNISYFERRKYSSGNFHDLTKGIEVSVKRKIKNQDLHYAKYYHDIRNQLYHQGKGITVDPKDVRGYAAVAVSLLGQLLGVDVTEIHDERLDGRASISQDSFLQLKRELPRDLDRFRKLINEVIETIEPKLVYPSTIAKLSDIAANVDVSSFPQKLRELRELIQSCIKDGEIRSWLLDLVSNDVEGDSRQVLKNSHFLMELGEDYISLYSLIIGSFFLPVGDVRKDDVDKFEDISFLNNDDYSIMGVYRACTFLADHLLKRDRIGMEDFGVLERTQELNMKLKMIIKRLEGLMQV